MQESMTLARPYARAAFEHAQDAEQAALWSGALGALAEAAEDPLAAAFIANPAVSAADRVKLMQAVVADKRWDAARSHLDNFLAVLAHNKRLALLPDIKILYETFLEEAEKTMTAHVTAFSPLSEDQMQKMTDSLTKRLGRKVTLQVDLDPAILGGAIIRAGDLVIDGSVRGKLHTLGSGMAA